MMVDFLANPNLASTTCRRCALGGGGASMPEAVARKLEETHRACRSSRATA